MYKFQLTMTKEISEETETYDVMTTYEKIADLLKDTQYSSNVEINIIITKVTTNTSGDDLPF
ncbi:MAG: hypothetical protein IJU91_02870 [Selenomonadaceae bacterium]|nr:hypothetical protein [Selenomonadaceae bacterium]